MKGILLAFLMGSCIFVNRVLPESLPAETTDRARELARIERELDAKRAWMETLDRREKIAFEGLLDLEEKLELTERLINRLASRETATERELRSEAKSLEQIASRLSYHRECSRRRLRTIYKRGRPVSQTMIWEFASPVDLASRIRLARRILEEDQNLAKTFETRKVHLEQKSQNLGENVAELSWLGEIKTEEQKASQGELREREKLLRGIRSEKRLCLQAMEGLEERAAEIRQIVDELQEKETHQRAEQPKGSGWFESLRGWLPWPVQGRVTSAFGEERHPLFHAGIKNSGIEIKTKAGTEIVAVADGRVIYLSRLRGYGNLLILEHGDEYYTLYARLSEISVWPGAEVRRLERVGGGGEGGIGPSPCLHFEIRKGKQPLDPLEWLK
ncbi:MAG: peptidoglycan DD-metalloendopeptidase family protein [Candidatus Zixiibacteriota bacterium]|nr:MAG: peptidoglycan DD-metalloendopeptidase family protein [candidate division Zixibacteria bacterium]